MAADALLAAWVEAAEGRGVSARPCPDGVLLEIEAMGSRFVGLRHGPIEQLAASLPGVSPEPSVLVSLMRTHAFTLGARAAVDRQGALIVVSDRPSRDLSVPAARLGWLMQSQVVANAMLSVAAMAAARGEAVGHDEAQTLFAAAQ